MSTNANTSNETTQTQGNDLVVEELKSVWKEYQTMKEQANRLAHSSEIPPEMVNAIYQAAHQRMNDKVYEVIRKQYEPQQQESLKEEATKQEAPNQESAAFQSESQSHNQHQHQSFSNQSSSTKGKTKKRYQFYRVENDRMIAGVCGGLAEYFNVDSALVRVLTVVATLLSVVPPNAFIIVPVAYVVGALLLPLKSDVQPSGENQTP